MIDAMKAEGVQRLIVISMVGIGESRVQAPFWHRSLLMPTFLRGSTNDKIMMEKKVIASTRGDPLRRGNERDHQHKIADLRCRGHCRARERRRRMNSSIPRESEFARMAL